MPSVLDHKPFGSPLWGTLNAQGNLVSMLGDVTTSENVAFLNAEARRLGGPVMVIDDASHTQPTSLKLYAALSHLVTVGSYYLVQDTRLDSDCALSFLTLPPGSVYWYCRKIQNEGGPARAVANITSQAAFRRSWKQDRSVEQWVITQHPGGYLLRLQGVKGGGRSDAR